jgi:uncharacterized protein YbaP (TraB family)
MTGRNWWPSRAASAAVAAVLLLAPGAQAAAATGAQPAADAAPGASIEPPPAAAPVPAAGFDQGTLWRIHAPSGAVGHLLGTIHIGQPRELGVPPAVWSLLLTANRLVVELAPPPPQDDSAERLQRLPRGESLARHLAPADLQKLQARLQAAGLGLRQPQQVKPWVLTQLLQSAAPLTLETLDDRLVRQAKAQRIAIASLETVEEQFGAFECIPLVEQVLLLKDTLAMPEGFFETLNREVLALYRAQRTAELVALLADRFPVGRAAQQASAQATQCIIAERNQRFAQRLQPLLAENGVFAAIGAAHLVGPGGVLARLAAAGYRLERMHAPTPDPAATETPR